MKCWDPKIAYLQRISRFLDAIASLVLKYDDDDDFDSNDNINVNDVQILMIIPKSQNYEITEYIVKITSQSPEPKDLWVLFSYIGIIQLNI